MEINNGRLAMIGECRVVVPRHLKLRPSRRILSLPRVTATTPCSHERCHLFAGLMGFLTEAKVPGAVPFLSTPDGEALFGGIKSVRATTAGLLPRPRLQPERLTLSLK